MRDILKFGENRCQPSQGEHRHRGTGIGLVAACPPVRRSENHHERLVTADGASTGGPVALTDVRTSCRLLHERATGTPARVGRAGISNGPTETVDGRRELRRSALGFRNLTHDIARSCSRPAGSGAAYVHDCEEPENLIPVNLQPAIPP
ncbi:hypothetical protein MF406_11050 [Georgenia sp. TF02-10]|nr:hypothetical protein [Georgenia sp. TF02-10]UNX56543.1 hypothetical protein MF406_11050 [Georgenia sp. TF02-10]